ncbi:hypothetical protein [Orrella marina]|uniref:Uncharacterized protein n=1 Tax=Orrella marina TaxID=2163011 RepID=A0A2R4XGA9_9BURK|nr:hypothetical protein [Orrella marina]AWB32815.1 hypothetical protein DBV39_02765 [Orrella marina]
MGLPELKLEGALATTCLMRADQANRPGPDDLAALLERIETVNCTEQVRVLQLTSIRLEAPEQWALLSVSGTVHPFLPNRTKPYRTIPNKY